MPSILHNFFQKRTVTFIAIAALLFAAIKVFLTAAPSFNASLWVEEGSTYYWSVFNLPFWKSLFQADCVYLNFTLRFGAIVLKASQLPPEYFPLAFKLFAQFIFSFQILLILHPVFHKLIPSLAIRSLYAVVLLTQYGHEFYLPQNSAYSNIFLMIFLFLYCQEKSIPKKNWPLILLLAITFVGKPTVMLPWAAFMVALLSPLFYRKLSLESKKLFFILFSLTLLQAIAIRYYQGLTQNGLSQNNFLGTTTEFIKNFFFLFSSQLFPSFALFYKVPWLRNLNSIFVLLGLLSLVLFRKKIFTPNPTFEYRALLYFLPVSYLIIFLMISTFNNSIWQQAINPVLDPLFCRHALGAYYFLSLAIISLMSHSHPSIQRIFFVSFFVFSSIQNVEQYNLNTNDVIRQPEKLAYEKDKYPQIPLQKNAKKSDCLPINVVGWSINCSFAKNSPLKLNLSSNESYLIKSDSEIKGLLVKAFDPSLITQDCFSIESDTQNKITRTSKNRWSYYQPTFQERQLVLKNKCPNKFLANVYYLK